LVLGEKKGNRKIVAETKRGGPKKNGKETNGWNTRNSLSKRGKQLRTKLKKKGGGKVNQMNRSKRKGSGGGRVPSGGSPGEDVLGCGQNVWIGGKEKLGKDGGRKNRGPSRRWWGGNRRERVHT